MGLTYNTVNLGYIKTTSLTEGSEANPDKPDVFYWVRRLKVTSVLAVQMVPAESEETVQDILIRVRHMLSQPRCPFTYDIAGQTVIDLPTGKDDANGPFPEVFSVDLVTEGSMLISWGITIRTADCDGRVNKIVSNRWTESATIGDDHLTTYRRQGRLVVAGRHGISPDAYRALVTPKIGPMFARKSAEYTLHENGLELAYSFVDEEKYILPPFPAIKAKGRMSETTTTNTGAKRYGRVWIELVGPPDVPKQVLLAKCVDIAISRAMQAGLQKNEKGRFIAGGGIDDEMFENRIALTVNWMMKPTSVRILQGKVGVNGVPDFLGGIVEGAGFGGIANLFGGNAQPVQLPPPKINQDGVDVSAIAMQAGWVGQPIPGTYQGVGIAPATRGDVEWLQLVGAAMSDPCLTNSLSSYDRTQNIAEPNKGVNTAFPSASIRRSTVLPPETPGGTSYDPNDKSDAMYDHYSAVLRYIHDEGVDVCPSMKKGTSGQLIRLSGESMRLEVEFSARRAGSPPEIPDPKAPTSGGGSNDPDWCYLGGTLSPEMIDIGADGATLIYSISGLLRFKALNPCAVNVISPIPPYLSRTVQDEARMAAALTNGKIVFLSGPQTGNPLNPFCGYTTQLSTSGATGVPNGGGGFPFN